MRPLVLAVFISLSATLPGSGKLPEIKGFVTDLVDLLSEAEEKKLHEQVRAYEKKTSNDIFIVFINTL